jgi:hypothetical protein
MDIEIKTVKSAPYLEVTDNFSELLIFIGENCTMRNCQSVA